MAVRCYKRWLFAGLCLLVGCGGGTTTADVQSATDAVNVEIQVEQICGREGSACDPRQVRALERAAYCANASIVYRHGHILPDAGIHCLPEVAP